MRIRNNHGVQIITTNDKAATMIAGRSTVPGTWSEVPKAEQLTRQQSEALDRAAAEAKAAIRGKGQTSIAASINDAEPTNRFA
ncbi:hypothetical protein [Mycolicibacterium neoaurum]|nr:hypothetical protein [Mycolicibacterium neoaurum]